VLRLRLELRRLLQLREWIGRWRRPLQLRRVSQLCVGQGLG